MCKEFGDVKYKDLTSKQAKHAYEDWVARGISLANHVCTVSSIVFRYAIEMEYATINPFANVKRKSAPQRKVVWTEDDVRHFLDTAYSQFEWRSIGLIVHMAFQWAQRVGDMRTLVWDTLDLDNGRLDLEQSKRRAEVHLPIQGGLVDMLKEQKKDFGFQPYVAPRVSPRAGMYSCYDMDEINSLVKDVVREAGLPLDSITAMDLRRTAITQMVEEGADIANIMQVSGHTNPQSVKPYLVNTFSGASNALSKRKDLI